MVEQVQGGPDLVGHAVYHLREILMMLSPEPAVDFVVHDVLRIQLLLPVTVTR